MTLQIALLILRLSFAAFFGIWVVEKFVDPTNFQAIFAHFYMIKNIPVEAIYAIGAFQAVILLGFLLGLFRFWTYGALMVMHGLSTASTWRNLINPYEGPNHLFWAAVPTLGVIVVLFLMRDEDNLFTLR